MTQKFKRGLAVTLAAMMMVSSYAPAVSAEEVIVEGTETIAAEEQEVNAAPVKNEWLKQDGVYVYVQTFEDGSKKVWTAVSSVTTPATCAQDGVTRWTVNELGGVFYDETISKDTIDHQYGGEWADEANEKAPDNYKAPTCDEEGFKKWYKTCGVCNKVEFTWTETLDRTTHAWEPFEETVAATCEADGLKTTGERCSICEATQNVKTEKLPGGHQWKENDDKAKPATCREEGYDYTICEECGKEDRVVLPKLEHGVDDWTVNVTKEPDKCGESGEKITEYTCNICNVTWEENETVTRDHEWEFVKALTEPTCSEEGWGSYKCANCKEYKEDVIPADKDAHIEKAYKMILEPATCEADGTYYEEIRCTICGNVLGETLDTNGERKIFTTTAPGHQAEDPAGTIVSETPATCQKAAEKVTEYECKNCGEKYTETVETAPKTKHEKAAEPYIVETVQEPTCTEKGVYTVYDVCKHCGKQMSAERPMTTAEVKHDFSVLKHKLPATCTADGEEIYECSKCKTETSKTLSKLNHMKEDPENEGKMISAYVESVSEDTATCTKAGTKTVTKTCSLCGDTDVTKDVASPALEHAFKETERITDPTCTVEGRAYGKCERCGETTTDLEVKKVKHTIAFREVRDAAEFVSCTVASAGYRQRYCTMCNTVYGSTEIMIPAGKHSYDVENAKIAWDAEGMSGLVTAECGECGYTTNQAFAFEDTDLKTNPATCTTNGSEYYERNLDFDGAVLIVKSKVTVLPAAHDYKEKKVEEESTPSTCTENGTDVFWNICTVCDEKEEGSRREETAALAPHNFSTTTETIKPATCTESGELKVTETCVNCDYVPEPSTVEIPALGHTEKEAVQENVKSATCKAEGSYDEVVRCARCNEVLKSESKKIPVKAHTAEALPAVESTCTATGLTAGEKCAVCGEILKAQTTVAKKAHTAGAAVKEYIKNASYTAAGSYDEVVYCSVCKTEMSRTAKAIPQLEKKGQTIKVDKKTKKKELKAKKAAKSKNTFRISATAASGKVTYEKLSGNKKITVKSNGKVIVAKGLKKGTYRVKVRLTAPGTDEFIKTSKKITIKVVVK